MDSTARCFFLFRLLFVQEKQLEGFHHKPIILYLARHLGLTNRATKTISSMGITVIIDSSPIHKVGLAINSHGQITPASFESKLALATGSFDDLFFD